MPLERVKYSLDNPPKWYWGLLIGGMVGWQLGQWTSWDGPLCIFLTGCFGLVVNLYRYADAYSKVFEEAWQSRGLQKDYTTSKLILDVHARKIVFRGHLHFDCYDFSDILEVSHEWVSRSSNGSLDKVDNKLIFKMKNPDKPIYQISFFTHHFAQEWLARINALLNN